MPALSYIVGLGLKERKRGGGEEGKEERRKTEGREEG